MLRKNKNKKEEGEEEEERNTEQLTYAPWSSEAAFHPIPTCEMCNPHPQWQLTETTQVL